LSATQAFDVEDLAVDLAGQRRSLPWIDLIETLRNIFIFGPVLVTWWSISGAVQMYRALLVARPDLAPFPFLYFWETGFDGRLELTLSKVAMIDAFIILALVITTVLLKLIEGVDTRGRGKRLRDARREIHSALSDAGLALAVSLPHGTIDAIERLDDVGRALLSDLRDDRSRLRDVEERQAKQAQILSEATSHLSQATGDLRLGVEVLSKLAPQIEGYLKAISEGQSSIASTQSRLQEATQSLNTTVTRVLVEQSENVQKAMQSLSTTVSRVLAEQSEGVQKATTSLSSSARATEAAVGRFSDIQDALMGQERGLLEALGREREGQDKLYAAFAKSLVEFEESLRGAALYSRAMYTMAVGVRDVADALPVISNTIRQKLGEAADTQIRAAAALEEAAFRIRPAVSPPPKGVGDASSKVDGGSIE